MTGLRTSSFGRSAGQSMVEFALVAPLFFLLLLTMIEFGRYVYQVQVVNQAAREGSRYAIVHGSTALCPSGPMPGGAANWCDAPGARIQGVVRAYAVAVEAGTITFPTMTWSPNNGRGSRFTLVVQSTFTPLLPLVPLPPITIQGASSLVIQH